MILCAVPLVYYFLFREAAPHDVTEGFGWSLLVVTFPAGLIPFFLVGWLVFLVHSLFGLWVPATAQVLALWGSASAVGYLQWFYLLPRLVRRVRARNRR
jgi:hypothetical protein